MCAVFVADTEAHHYVLIIWWKWDQRPTGTKIFVSSRSKGPVFAVTFYNIIMIINCGWLCTCYFSFLFLTSHLFIIEFLFGLPRWLSGKESACHCRRGRCNLLVRKIPLEKEMATDSSILVWKIIWTEEPGGLQSMELQELDATLWLNNNNNNNKSSFTVFLLLLVNIFQYSILFR